MFFSNYAKKYFKNLQHEVMYLYSLDNKLSGKSQKPIRPLVVHLKELSESENLAKTL